ncbi:MAG: FMN-dependent NADH-azoreductase [Alphaproteobacteria bacterium]|nr:FMN-dependent NADH-azoreductase [Alphaproteobacteria bacterium]
MTTILHLYSSARTEGSATRALTAEIVAQLQRTDQGTTVVYRDLTKQVLPHISPEFLNGLFAGGEHANHATVKLSDLLIDEVNAADILVIGAPMYNFSVPSQLKAWIDHVLRAGKTFKYSAEGMPIGLVTGKRAIVAIANGGVYTTGPMVAFDHVEPLMRQVLGFIGITDVTFIRAEKQAFGVEAASQELEKAKHDIAGNVAKAA